MAGQVVRAGGSVLAALTIVAGGALVGVGAAGAQSSDMNMPVACDPFTDEDFKDDPFPCDLQRFDERAYAGAFHVLFTGRDRVSPGENAVVRAYFSNNNPGRSGLELTSATVRTPRGFVFTSGSVRLNEYNSSNSGVPVDASFTVDSATGDVTVTAPTGGVDIPSFEDSPGGVRSQVVLVTLNYEPTEYVIDGKSSVRFSGTGVPDSDWVATGVTQVAPDFGGFGSSGSLDSDGFPA